MLHVRPVFGPTAFGQQKQLLCLYQAPSLSSKLGVNSITNIKNRLHCFSCFQLKFIQILQVAVASNVSYISIHISTQYVINHRRCTILTRSCHHEWPAHSASKGRYSSISSNTLSPPNFRSELSKNVSSPSSSSFKNRSNFTCTTRTVHGTSGHIQIVRVGR